MKRSRSQQQFQLNGGTMTAPLQRNQQRRGRRPCRRVLSSYLLVFGSLWLSSQHALAPVDADRLLYTSSSSLKLPTTPFLLTLQMRGGDSKRDNDKKEDRKQHANHNNDDDDDDDKTNHNIFMGLRKDWLWATGALFRLNEHVLAEALRDTTLSTKNPTNGRGGALVVKRRPASSSSATAATKLSSSGGSSNGNHHNTPPPPQHHTPFDTSRVSPLDKRLLVDEDGDYKKHNDSKTLSANNKTNAAANSLWWANVWAQQILDADNVNANNNHSNNRDNNHDPSVNNSKVDTKIANPNKNDRQQQQQQQLATKKEEDSIVAPVKEDNHKNNNKAQRNKEKTTESASPSTPTTDAETSEVALTPVTTSVASPYASSGYWGAIDQVASLGLATFHPAFRVSLRLRAARKATARITGLHGAISGKGRPQRPPQQRQRRRRLLLSSSTSRHDEDIVPLDEDDLGMIRRRIAAIDRARETLERAAAAEAEAKRQMRWTWLFGTSEEEEEQDFASRVDQKPLAVDSGTAMEATNQTAQPLDPVKDRKRIREEEKLEEKRRKERAKEEELEEKRRKEKAKQDELEEKRRLERAKEEEKEEKRRSERVMAIDKQILEGQFKLQELQCEKDALQRRPNPLWNYTTETKGNEETHTRTFNFPPPELVEEYLEVLFWSGRLVKLNHTHLWKNAAELEDEDDDETIGDDLLTPSGDAYKLYEKNRRQTPQQQQKRQQRIPGDDYRRGNGGGGSWLLRQTIGKGGSLGEKIGETAETAAYKGVCQALMGVLARGLSALHGVNILSYSDIRLFMEQSPDLPPVGGILIPGSGGTGSNYAQQALSDVMRRGARKNKRRKQNRLSDNAGIQREAIVETLLSHCQISAPLLKLFPLAWQRALLGNIITLVAAVVSDFCEGVQFQILGHQLSFLFKPITESDVVQHLSMAGGHHGFNHRRARPDQFEAAVRATADEINGNLKFLDRWHERALGGGMLRAQIADLIARLVLTLFDEVLCGARMDLWSAQAGGPRLVAGLEYRTTPNYLLDAPSSGN